MSAHETIMRQAAQIMNDEKQRLVGDILRLRGDPRQKETRDYKIKKERALAAAIRTIEIYDWQ